MSDRELQRRTVSFSVNVGVFLFLTLVRWFIHISDMLHSLSIDPTWFNTRLVAFSCLTSICLIHGIFLKLGLRLQNALGVFKLVVFTLIAVSGILCLAGVKGIQVRDEYEKPDNFTWSKFWEGSGTGSNAFVNGLYNVIWCESAVPFLHALFANNVSRSFTGYSNANYALSEVRDPVRTIKRAAPYAMIAVTAVYLLINMSYFAVVSKKDILESRQIVAWVIIRKCVVNTFVQLFSQSLVFSKPIWPYNRKGGFSFCQIAHMLLTHIYINRPLAPSSHYLRSATFWRASLPKAEVTNQSGPFLLHWPERTFIQLSKNLVGKEYFHFLPSFQAIDHSMRH